MIHCRLSKIFYAAFMVCGPVACLGNGSSSDESGSVTMAAPSLPTEVKDVKKWTYDLYCSAQNGGEGIRTAAQLIASSTTATGGVVTVTGDKVATVKAGWFCLMDMTTEEGMTGVSDAKPSVASPSRKVFFSSVATQVPADRKLKLELTRKYSATNANTGTSTSLGTGTGFGTSTATNQNPSVSAGVGTSTATGIGTSTVPKSGNTQPGAGTVGPAPSGNQILLKVNATGATVCPQGKKFNTDPRIMACQ